MATIENISNDGGGHNLPVLSVSELSGALKRTVEDSFSLVRVRGEISGFKRAPSGHLYFSLKDENAVLEGVCWRGIAGRLGIAPEDGMEVVATGRITTYAARSKYQIVIESIDLAGEGAFLKLIEERKKKLAKEGLFDGAHKQPIPFLPDVIGVVTSPGGAVIQDILHRLSERFARRVLLWPVLVQGKEAPLQITAAINGFNQIKHGGPVPCPDVLIVARGGGSLEDLSAFNEEDVVRAAFASRIPLISAVGHETDTTLIDFAADVRAPTPSAAAEMAVPVRMELLAQAMDMAARLTGAMTRLLQTQRNALAGLVRGLPNLRRMAEEAAQRLDDWSDRLKNSPKAGMERRWAILRKLSAKLSDPRRNIAHALNLLNERSKALEMSFSGFMRERQSRFAQAAGLLNSYSHERVLERGFVLVYDGSARHIGLSAQLKTGAEITISFYDGDKQAVVGEKKPRQHRSKKKSLTDDNGGQGTLL